MVLSLSLLLLVVVMVAVVVVVVFQGYRVVAVPINQTYLGQNWWTTVLARFGGGAVPAQSGHSRIFPEAMFH